MIEELLKDDFKLANEALLKIVWILNGDCEIFSFKLYYQLLIASNIKKDEDINCYSDWVRSTSRKYKWMVSGYSHNLHLVSHRTKTQPGRCQSTLNLSCKFKWNIIFKNVKYLYKPKHADCEEDERVFSVSEWQIVIYFLLCLIEETLWNDKNQPDIDIRMTSRLMIPIANQSENI